MSSTKPHQKQVSSDHIKQFWNRFASLKSQRRTPAAFEGETQDEYYRRIGEWERPAILSLTRAKHVAQLIHHRHGGPCDTADGPAWLDIGLPYVIDAAEILGDSAFVKGLAWTREHCPTHLEEVGFDAVVEVIDGMLERCDDAKAAGRPWLPTMADITVSLRPTWAETTRLGLSGWGAIDRPPAHDLRARKTDRQRQARRDRGVAPMATRTKTKDKEAVAVELGVSLRTVERWAGAGTMDANVERRRVGKVKHRNIGEERASDFRHPAPPANDNAELLLTEMGYHGRHLILTAAEVQHTLRRFPNLAAGLGAHLDAIDAEMQKPKSRTPLARQNLLRYRNRRVGLDLRKAA